MRGLWAALVLMGSPVLAQEDLCGDLSRATQTELNTCAFRGWEAADAALNEAYGAAVAEARGRDERRGREEGGAEEMLCRAQRAWVSYRDADCDVEASFFEGGSAEPMTLYGCMTQHTEDRTARLWGYVQIHRPLREDEP